MRIAILMECSGVIRDAFLARGHDAISVDLLPCERGGPHWQGDVREYLRRFGHTLDAFIAHPVCRILCNSGGKHLYIGGKKINGRHEPRWRELEDAAEMFRFLDGYEDVPLRCVENPIMHKHAQKLVGRNWTQLIQPWQFGHQETKGTGLWLTGFPPLVPTWVVGPPPADPVLRKQWAVVHRATPGEDRSRLRSRSYWGIGDAMAEQWGGDLRIKLLVLERRVVRLDETVRADA